MTFDLGELYNGRTHGSFVKLRRRTRLCLRAQGERCCTVMHRGCEAETVISLVCFYLLCVQYCVDYTWENTRPSSTILHSSSTRWLRTIPACNNTTSTSVEGILQLLQHKKGIIQLRQQNHNLPNKYILTCFFSEPYISSLASYT